MMDFTKKNLRELEDAAVKHGFSETQMARFAGGELGCKTIGLALEGVKPGRRQARRLSFPGPGRRDLARGDGDRGRQGGFR